MKKRTITALLAVPSILLLAGAFSWWWLLHTETGARWVFEKAVTATDGSLKADRVSGDLSTGLKLKGLIFDDGGFRVTAGELRATIEIELMPIAVHITTLHAEKIQLQITQSAGEEPGKTDSPDSFSMPIPLVFSDLRLSGIEYLDASGEAPFMINSLEAAGSVNKTLVLDRLSVALPEDRLELSGQLAFSSPHALDAEFLTQGRLELEGVINGSLDSAEIVLDIMNPQTHVSGKLARLLDTPAWDLEVRSASIQLPHDSQDPEATLTEVQAQTSGEWPQFKLDLTAGIELPGMQPTQLALSGNGTSTGFSASKLTLQGPELALDATGTISWEDTLRLGLTATLERLDPRGWVSEWPESHPVNGHIDADWEGEDLTLNDFNLGVSGTKLTANGHGVVALESGLVDVALNWQNFNWPLSGLSPIVSSESGSLRVSGKPDDWKLDGNIDLQSGDFPPGRLQLSGTGDAESMNLAIHEGNVLGGTISGNLFWKWTDNQPFTAQMLARQIEITPLAPDYPGVLNTRVTLDGALNPFQIDLDIHQLDGTIRERPLSGQGGLIVDQGQVIIDQLHLTSDSSSLTLDGSLYDPGGIDFATHIESLSLLSKDFQGSLNSQGNISLNPAQPGMSVTLSGQDLVLGPVKIGQIETRTPSDSGSGITNEFVFSRLDIGKQDIESLSVGLGGDEPLQRIVVKALVEGTGIALDLEGSVNDWASPTTSGWQGELSGLRIDHRDQFYLDLDQATALEWTPSRLALEPLCLSGTHEARLCMESAWYDQDELNISARLDAIPVSLLGMVVDSEFRFSQILSGSLSWSQPTAKERNGSARIEISPGTISAEDDNRVLLSTGPGLFGFELAGGALTGGRLDLALPGTGEVDVDFNIPDLSQGGYSPVRGQLRVDLHDLRALGPVIPLFDSISGAVNIDVSLSGILADPAFIGRASLSNGQFDVGASGSSFSEINISGEVTEMDRTELKGSFRAGEGTGAISTIIYFEDLLSPVIEFAVKGESLTIINLPELNITANPDFSLNWRNRGLEVNGSLIIPAARLAPSYIPQSSAGQSQDVVIVAGELPKAEENFLRDNPFNIRGNLEVTLGEEVEIVLQMARMNVHGSTLFSWQDELLPTASGNFDMQGEIQAYGQHLRISRGRISFPDIPADNPHLNIRAERDIFGNSQIQKAGLMVTGNLRRPLIEPYTVPMTNKDRARTLLVTGSDFNYEQGVGAVAVGYYVLPRLYISYGIGVFEDGNVISVRYDLPRRFGIRVTSGQRDTGVDLNYTIER